MCSQESWQRGMSFYLWALNHITVQSKRQTWNPCRLTFDTICAGAKVAVNCHASHANDKESKSSRIHGVTDENGDYFIDLPSELHAIPDLNKKCSVHLVRMPRNLHCRPAHIRKRKTVRLSSVGNGIRTYEAGTMRLLHSASGPPEACMKKPSGPRESYSN